MRISLSRPLSYIRRYPLDLLIMTLNLLVPATIMLVMMSGDQVQRIPPPEALRVYWRLLDPLIHMTLGFLIVSPFIFYRRVTFKDLLLAGLLVFMAISADLDHAIGAGSLSLQAITRVIPRTPLHSFWNAAAIGLIAWAVSRKFRIGWLFFAAVLSHFIRDAHTGGMLLFPWTEEIYRLSLTEYRLLIILLYLATNLLIYSATVLLPSESGRWWKPALPTGLPAALEQPVQMETFSEKMHMM